MQAGLSPAGVTGSTEVFEPVFEIPPILVELDRTVSGFCWLLVAEVFEADPEEYTI
jgi:hypothetical protein